MPGKYSLLSPTSFEDSFVGGTRLPNVRGSDNTSDNDTDVITNRINTVPRITFRGLI